MARTSENAVKSVLDTSLTTDQIAQFIADASLWVTEELSAAGLSEDRLELIERYLACALIRMRDLGLSSADMSGVRESYQVDPNVTEYLLRAATFDSTGAVRRQFLSPKDRPSAGWLVGKGFRDEAESDPAWTPRL